MLASLFILSNMYKLAGIYPPLYDVLPVCEFKDGLLSTLLVGQQHLVSLCFIHGYFFTSIAYLFNVVAYLGENKDYYITCKCLRYNIETGQHIEVVINLKQHR